MRAARARALGGGCSQCPNLPAYPAQCVAEEPMQWRDDAPEMEGRECPVWLGHRYENYFEIWRMYEKGFLPYEGPWTAQPAHVIRALKIIGTQVATVEREHIEAMRQERGS